MAECPYYGNNSYCKKTGTFQSADHLRRYCITDSNWKSCANFQGGGCFLTTACVHYAGLPDDCEELTGMRNFRDEYLLSLPEGQSMYNEYYRLAPEIVEAIESSDDRTEILASILSQVRQCVQFSKEGKDEMAFNVYTNMFDGLKHKFQVF